MLLGSDLKDEVSGKKAANFYRVPRDRELAKLAETVIGMNLSGVEITTFGGFASGFRKQEGVPFGSGDVFSTSVGIGQQKSFGDGESFGNYVVTSLAGRLMSRGKVSRTAR